MVHAIKERLMSRFPAQRNENIWRSEIAASEIRFGKSLALTTKSLFVSLNSDLANFRVMAFGCVFKTV